MNASETACKPATYVYNITFALPTPDERGNTIATKSVIGEDRDDAKARLAASYGVTVLDVFSCERLTF